jgi:hypothetical protein
MRYFDYETIARQTGIPAEKLARLAKSFAEEEPNDPMLAELHTLSPPTSDGKRHGGVEAIYPRASHR